MPPPVLVLTGDADTADPQIWHFSVTNAQGSSVTLYYGDGESDTRPNAAAVSFQHRYDAPGDYHVVAHSQAGGQADTSLDIVVARAHSGGSQAMLPFSQSCQVLSQNGGVIADGVPLSPVWPTVGRTTDVGHSYDHQAEAGIDFYDALSGTNRTVVTDRGTFKVIEAIYNPFLPHVVLALRRINPGGGSG